MKRGSDPKNQKFQKKFSRQNRRYEKTEISSKNKDGLGPEKSEISKNGVFRKNNFFFFFFSRNLFREILTPKSKIFRFFGAEPLFIFVEISRAQRPPLGARPKIQKFSDFSGPSHSSFCRNFASSKAPLPWSSRNFGPI